MRKLMLYAVLLLLVLVGCKQTRSSVKPKTSSSVAVGHAEDAGAKPKAAEAKVVFVGGDGSERPVLRFAATITNPNPYPIGEVRVEWVAKDSTGAIVGSFQRTIPAIGPASEIPYVGGALVKGRPTTVELTVKDSGHKISQAPSKFTASNIIFTKDEFGGAAAYKVTADITTDSKEHQRQDVNLLTLLKDSSGKIVGADFTDADGLPETIPPMTRFKAEFNFVYAQADAASAEVYADGGGGPSMLPFVLPT